MIDHGVSMLAMLMELPPADRRAMGRFAESIRMEGECAVWTGQLTRNGYPRFYDGENVVSAHRWIFERLVAPVGDSMQLHHVCRTRACVHPWHLQPMTSREHNAITHAMKTTCPQGHPYDEVNTRWYEGRRYCRTCNNNGRRPVRHSRLAEIYDARRARDAS